MYCEKLNRPRQSSIDSSVHSSLPGEHRKPLFSGSNSRVVLLCIGNQMEQFHFHLRFLLNRGLAISQEINPMVLIGEIIKNRKISTFSNSQIFYLYGPSPYEREGATKHQTVLCSVAAILLSLHGATGFLEICTLHFSLFPL